MNKIKRVKSNKGEMKMRKKFINIRMAAVKSLTGSFALLALLAFVLPMSAQANMAANTQITNAAHLSYNDGVSTQAADSSVTVTVSLVPAAPTVPTGTGNSGQYTAPNTVLNNTFTVVAQSNGPDSYTLTPGFGSQTNNANSGSFGTMSPASPITLGGSIVVADATHTNNTTTIYVPSDGTADSVVNQIQAGDSVVVGANTAVQVQSVTDPGTSGIATIVLQAALSGAPSAGDPVREQMTITVPVNSGTIVSSGSSIIITKHLTVASVTDPGQTVTSADVTDTYTSGAATFTKYVRNASVAVVGSTSLQYPAGTGPTYYRTGVTATTGQVLEYLIVVANSGTGSISSAVVTDGLPVTYANFNTTPYSGSAVTYYNESGTASYLSATSDTDAATWSSPTLTVNVGTGATSSAGGTIAAAASVHVVYQVTVK